MMDCSQSTRRSSPKTKNVLLKKLVHQDFHEDLPIRLFQIKRSKPSAPVTVESFRPPPTFSSPHSSFPPFPNGLCFKSSYANRAPVHSRIANVPIDYWAPNVYENVNQSLVAGDRFVSHGRTISNPSSKLNFTDSKLSYNTVDRQDNRSCTAQSAINNLGPVRSRQSAISNRRQLSLPICPYDRHHGLDQQFSIYRKVNDTRFRTCFRTGNCPPGSACIQRQIPTDCKSAGLFLRSQTPAHYNPMQTTEAFPNRGPLVAEGHHHPRIASTGENFEAMTRRSEDEFSLLSRGSAVITSTPSDTPKHVEEPFYKSVVFHGKNRRLRRPERSVLENLQCHNSQPPKRSHEVGIQVDFLDTARTTSSSDISSIEIYNTLFVQPSVNHDQPKIPLLKLPKNETPPFSTIYPPDHPSSREAASHSRQIAKETPDFPEEEKHPFKAATRLFNNSPQIIQPLRLINGPTSPLLNGPKSPSERKTATEFTAYKMQSKTADSNASATPDLEKISDDVRTTSLGNLDQADLGSTKQAEVGSTKQAEVGSTKQAEVGSTKQAEVGSTKQADLGSTKQAEVGSTKRAEVGSTKRAEVGSTKRSELESTYLPCRGMPIFAPWDKSVKSNTNEFTADSSGENESYSSSSSSSVGSLPRSQTNSLSGIRTEGHRDILRCSNFAAKRMRLGGQETIYSTKSLDILRDEDQSNSAEQNGHQIEILLEPDNSAQKENRGTNRKQIVLPKKYVIEKFRSNFVPEESIVNEHMECPEISLEITTDSEIADLNLSESSEKMKDSAEGRLEVKENDSSIELLSSRDMSRPSLKLNFDSLDSGVAKAHVILLDADDTLIPTSELSEEKYLDLDLENIPESFKMELERLDAQLTVFFQKLHDLVVVEQTGGNYVLSVIIITNATLSHIKSTFERFLPELSEFFQSSGIRIEDLVCSARDLWAAAFPYEHFYHFWKAWALENILRELQNDGVPMVTLLSIGDDEPERRAAAYVETEMEGFVRTTKIVKMVDNPKIVDLIVQLKYVNRNLRRYISAGSCFDVKLNLTKDDSGMMVSESEQTQSPLIPDRIEAIFIQFELKYKILSYTFKSLSKANAMNMVESLRSAFTEEMERCDVDAFMTECRTLLVLFNERSSSEKNLDQILEKLEAGDEELSQNSGNLFLDGIQNVVKLLLQYPPLFANLSTFGSPEVQGREVVVTAVYLVLAVLREYQKQIDS